MNASITQLRMAGLAIDVVAFLASCQHGRHCLLVRSGQLIAISIAVLAAEEITVGIQLLFVYGLVIQLCDGSGNGIPRRSAVRIELAGTQRNKLGLVMHVLPAAGQNSHAGARKQQPCHADLCRTINTAPPLFLPVYNSPAICACPMG